MRTNTAQSAKAIDRISGRSVHTTSTTRRSLPSAVCNTPRAKQTTLLRAFAVHVEPLHAYVRYKRYVLSSWVFHGHAVASNEVTPRPRNLTHKVSLFSRWCTQRWPACLSPPDITSLRMDDTSDLEGWLIYDSTSKTLSGQPPSDFTKGVLLERPAEPASPGSWRRLGLQPRSGLPDQHWSGQDVGGGLSAAFESARGERLLDLRLNVSCALGHDPHQHLVPAHLGHVHSLLAHHTLDLACDAASVAVA